MEYEILDRMKDESDERLQRFLEMNPGTYAVSKIFEAEEPFEGSDENTRLFIFSNYMSKTGLINLAIVIREEPIEENAPDDGFMKPKATVQTSIFPLYLTKTPVYDMPEKIDPPEITAQRAEKILQVRNLPKMKKNETFDETKHKWSVNYIAQKLNMSNRIVAQYCKAMGV